MTDARRRRRLVPTAAIALLTLAAASGARASCTASVGDHVFALGSPCTASGSYSPTVTTPVSPDAIVGLFANSGGSITTPLSPITVTATEPDSYAVYVSSGGTIALSSLTSLETLAENSFAVFSDGGSVSLTGGSMTTEADGSPGLVAFPGSISATDTTIKTYGDPNDAGTQSDAVLVAFATGTVTLTNDTIMTFGEGGDGVLAEDKGTATLNGVTTLTTTKDDSIGLYAVGGGVIDATGPITITTGSASASTGLDAYGAYAEGAGSQINLNAGTTVTTNWTDAYGLYASNGGAINAEDSPSVTTYGTGAIGVYASGAASSPGSASTIAITGASVTTNGNSAAGVEADGGGQVTVNGGSVTTKGSDAPGIVASGTGSIATLSGESLLTITTTNDHSIGLYAAGGGVIDATGPIAITTGSTSASTGLNAYGANANGAGSQVNLAATTITTVGANAHGLYASNGGVIDASGATGVTTSGTGAIGLYASGSGSTIAAGGASIATHGGSAAGVQADGGGGVTLNGASSLTTAGNGSIGLYALGGGVINALGQTTIATSGTTLASTGLNAYGVNADGVGSQINLAATTITTTGEGAAGLYASDATGMGHGGAIAVSGPLGVVTAGASAYGAWAQGAGSTIALNGPSAFTINGAAFALFAGQGGAISTANTLGLVINGGAAGGVEANGSGSSATLRGSTTVALNGNQNTGLLATAGGLISTQGATTIAVSGAQSIGVQALSGAVTAAGALNVATSQATSTAFALSGTSPSIIASGGGTVSAAGNAIAFINAANAVATFDNFNIKNTAGDLIFADPSTATVNFNNTVANAGAGNLLNAALGSTIAFNANASTLTGAIQTDPTSVTNVSLTNGTNWTMSASSTATSLNLANSAILFSPSGGFKTLTVGSYVGTGAKIALNTALGGPNAGSTDQLVINGGSATGSTSLAIKNTSGGAGAATSGNGIPLVVVTNGGTTSPSAFYLANGAPILAGGFEYTLGRNSNQDWYLTSSPAATMSQIQSSVTSVAQAQLNQLITTRVLGSLLLGATEQVNGCSCGGGFASIGSLSLGSHGRWSLNDSVTLLAGAAFESYYQDGANVRAAPIVAASLRYDPPNWGKSRPFFELGAAASPYIDAAYTRYYTNGLTPAQGIGSAVDRSISVFGRVGWVDRLTPVDEAAVFTDLVRGWQQSGGYSEAANALNPFPATVSTGVDRQDVVRFGAQYTHLLFGNIEANISGAIAYGFDNEFGSRVSLVDFGSVAPYPLLNSGWTEFGGRLAYRFSKNLVMDAFMIGTLGGDIGPTLHAGLGVRYAF